MISVLCQAHSTLSTGATNACKCNTHSPCSQSQGFQSMNASHPTPNTALYMAFLSSPMRSPRQADSHLKMRKLELSEVRKWPRQGQK